MPYIKATFTVSLTIDRYYRYDEGEDPDAIYDLLFANPYGGTGDDPAPNEVERELLAAIPGSDDVNAYTEYEDCDLDAPEPEVDAPHWSELMDDEEERVYREGKRLEELFEKGVIDARTFQKLWDEVIG